MMFGKRQVPEFTSRSQAFDFMFSYLVDKGKDMMEAAEQANTFANLIATNKKLPDTPPKEMNTIEQGVALIKQITAIKTESPEVWDFVSSLASGVIGGITGGSTKLEEPPVNNIDFDNLT